MTRYLIPALAVVAVPVLALAQGQTPTAGGGSPALESLLGQGPLVGVLVGMLLWFRSRFESMWADQRAQLEDSRKLAEKLGGVLEAAAASHREVASRLEAMTVAVRSCPAADRGATDPGRLKQA